MRKNKYNNPWSPEDEGSHYPTMREWWTFETIFKTIEDQRKYNLMVIMSYNMERPGSFFQYVLFDINSKKCILRKDIDDKIEKFKHGKNKLDLRYGKNTAKGIFPKYELHLNDEKQKFKADIKYNAKSLPHWILQDVTNGELPLGLNFYKYGYIPNNEISGTIKLNQKEFQIKGKGYLEHIWGDWSYQNPLLRVSNIKKTVSTYINLGKFNHYDQKEAE